MRAAAVDSNKVTLVESKQEKCWGGKGGGGWGGHFFVCEPAALWAFRLRASVAKAEEGTGGGGGGGSRLLFVCEPAAV
jgi:hypothetical protein